jgi:hypothetical protein
MVSFFVSEDSVWHVKFTADCGELIMAALRSHTHELKAVWVGTKHA